MHNDYHAFAIDAHLVEIESLKHYLKGYLHEFGNSECLNKIFSTKKIT